MMKKTVCLLIAGILACSMVVPAFAENRANAQLRSDFVIEIDGEKYLFTRADGSVALPILYNDTTYLPLRTIGEIMGKNVNWDESTKTITLSGKREETDQKIHIVATESKDIKVQEKSDFVIEIDGITKEFKTTSRSKMNPIVYNGSTYLPLRAIGEIMDKDIAWDGDTQTVSLTSKGSSKTKKDRFETADDNSAEITSEYEDDRIGIEKAKEIALAHAKLNEKQVNFITEKEDWIVLPHTELNEKQADITTKTREWIEIYRVEFYFDSKEYDYEIDAKTGDVLSFDSDVIGFVGLEKGKQISIEQAKNVALSDADVKNSQATFKRAELCEDHDEFEYRVEFYTTDFEYVYTINALDGKVVEVYFTNLKGMKSNFGRRNITLEEAKKIALVDAGVLNKDTEFNLAEFFSLDTYFNVFRCDFKSGENEYMYTIDAATGDILYFQINYE